jgi:hypothetical protein
MQDGWPASLPRNTALMYQVKIEYEDYFQTDTALFDTLGSRNEDMDLKMHTFFLFKHLNNRKLSS